MINWKRLCDRDGKQGMWQYLDDKQDTKFATCDDKGWINVNVLYPSDGHLVMTCSEEGDRRFDTYYRSSGWTYSHVAPVGWQPSPEPMEL